MFVPAFSAGYQRRVLHTQHIFHSLGGFLLCSGGDMGIGIQGESRREVAQYSGNRLNVNAVLEGEGGEGMPLRYNYDKPEKPFNTNGF